MEWDAIVWKPKTKYQSLESQNFCIPKATNAKTNSNNLDDLHSKVNKLTTQVGAQAPGGSGYKLCTCGGDHDQAYCPRKTTGGTASFKRTPPGSKKNGTKIVEVLSCTYFV